MVTNVRDKVKRSLNREQKIGDHRHMHDLETRLDQGARDRHGQVNAARWQSALGKAMTIEPMGDFKDSQADEASLEVTPLHESKAEPSLAGKWVEAGKNAAAAAFLGIAAAGAANAIAAEVPVSERSHITATDDVTKMVLGKVKRDGKVYEPAGGGWAG